MFFIFAANLRPSFSPGLRQVIHYLIVLTGLTAISLSAWAQKPETAQSVHPESDQHHRNP